MAWIDALTEIEDLEDAEFDEALINRFERAAAGREPRPIRFSTPTFKEYETSELKGCGKNSFPAFSITAAACGLNCDHCQKKILEPMIPATNPEMLDKKVRHLVENAGLNGFLLSGGSNKRNEINYLRYLPVVEQLKRDYPEMRVAVHSALMKEDQAKAMESAGVDTVMMDVIGANETIEEVYKLKRPVEDFEETLAALCGTSMEVTPHIVVGLHYGRILGEANALDIVSRYPVTALVLVVIMPFYAKPGTFETPATSDVGDIFYAARERLPEQQVLLGCARPPGMHKRVTDAYAIMAGLDGIAFPAEGAVSVAHSIGRPFEQAHSCCSIKLGSDLKTALAPSCAA
jgi:uncharacterized radical SAM superfamily protein